MFTSTITTSIVCGTLIYTVKDKNGNVVAGTGTFSYSTSNYFSIQTSNSADLGMHEFLIEG